MRDTHGTATEHDKPWRCELRIKGHRDDRWADWFEGLSFAHESEGILMKAMVYTHNGYHPILAYKSLSVHRTAARPGCAGYVVPARLGQ
jgi:hypothetical protein